MKIFFVRHGETESNAKKIIMGSRIDDPLNKNGKRQARALCNLLSEDFDIIFSSPLKRASETAKTVSEYLRITHLTDDRLKEIDVGSLSGKTPEELEDSIRDKMALEKAENKKIMDCKSFGGESVTEVYDRVKNFISDIKNKYPNKKILVITHAGILRAISNLYSYNINTDLHNTCIHEIEV